ncbi:hypothetical protein M514_07973 [Trichuris suis]|uniref:Uncharacterized protein n=1 Tax=Trichuris suis TaxID=68888 RepID=A0A085N3P2_9BILA|nr:hypothetical protein M514_07973 [Trichuris suis]
MRFMVRYQRPCRKGLPVKSGLVRVVDEFFVVPTFFHEDFTSVNAMAPLKLLEPALASLKVRISAQSPVELQRLFAQQGSSHRNPGGALLDEPHLQGFLDSLEFGRLHHLARDELGKLDEWPQINGNEPMEMDQKG